MPDPRCWRCMGLPMPTDGMARFGLCADCLRARVAEVMNRRDDQPAAANDRPIRRQAK